MNVLVNVYNVCMSELQSMSCRERLVKLGSHYRSFGLI